MIDLDILKVSSWTCGMVVDFKYLSPLEMSPFTCRQTIQQQAIDGTHLALDISLVSSREIRL